MGLYNSEVVGGGKKMLGPTVCLGKAGVFCVFNYRAFSHVLLD